MCSSSHSQLWYRTMNDYDGPAVAESVYRVLFGAGVDCLAPDDVAFAVHTAMCTLRNKGIPPSRWATYVHIGI